jgi:DNA-binding PadR family transcriptional regulator
MKTPRDRALQEPAFLVLTALAAEPLHGYALVRAVREISGDRVRLHAGALYAILDRLRDGGLVEVDREEVVESRLRRYYRLSDAGADRLAAEAARMEHNARAARARLRLQPGRSLRPQADAP